jgi:cytochrome c553
MRRITLFILLSFYQLTSFAQPPVSPAHGIDYPTGLENWRVISTSLRQDNDTQRVILGNSIAIDAARQGKTDPWPEGTILAKLVWKNRPHPIWKEAIVPGDFVHTEIMIKDSSRFNTTHHWGFARWVGNQLTPFGEDASAAETCSNCHEAAKDSDYVFTVPAILPKPSTADEAYSK